MFNIITKHGKWPRYVWKFIYGSEAAALELARGIVASYVGDHPNYKDLQMNLEFLRDEFAAGRGWRIGEKEIEDFKKKIVQA